MLYSMLSPVLVLYEELAVSIQTYKYIRSVYGIYDQEWKELTADEKLKIVKYYEFIEHKSERRLQIMARESSIQLTYQNALVLYQYVHPPLIELDYSNS